jgi:hypothetical protein
MDLAIGEETLEKQLVAIFSLWLVIFFWCF